MTKFNSTSSQGSPHSAVPQDMGFSPWQRLKTKRISYLTVPLIMMATVVEQETTRSGYEGRVSEEFPC